MELLAWLRRAHGADLGGLSEQIARAGGLLPDHTFAAPAGGFRFAPGFEGWAGT